MGVADDLSNTWFKHDCVLLSGAGASPYGMSEGESAPFKAYISQRTDRVDTPTGQSLVTTTTLHCPLSLHVDVGDQIGLPEPYLGVWEVTARSAHDGAGNPVPAHQKLFLTTAGTNPDVDHEMSESPYG